MIRLIFTKIDIVGYNPYTKKDEILIVFEDMIADMLTNKKLSPIVTDAFIRGEKLSISLVYIV